MGSKKEERVSGPKYCFERVMFFDPANKSAWLKKYELDKTMEEIFKCANCEDSGGLRMKMFFSAVIEKTRKTKGVWCGPCPKCGSENTPFVYLIPNDEL